MTKNSPQPTSPGPFRADQIRPGDPYELSNGHLVPHLPDFLRRDILVEGEVQGLRNAIVEVLTARGLAVDDDMRAALASTHDAALLTVLLRQAATATTMAELLESVAG